MYQYFPGVYWPNLVLHNSLACGAKFDDVHNACAAAREVLIAGADESDPEFVASLYEGHLARAQLLEERAEKALREGCSFTAGAKYLQAVPLYMGMDFMTYYLDPRKKSALLKQRECFRKGVSLSAAPHSTVEFVEAPFEGEMLDAVFVPASGQDGMSPVVIHLNGTHSTLEWPYLIDLTKRLADRGVASLTIDHPGGGTAIHNKGLKLRYDSEVYVSAIIDYLSGRSDVDASRIGVCGASLGGYTAPRATIFEDRIKACACFGALYEFPKDLWGVKGDPNARMHFTEEQMDGLIWSFGAKDYDEFIEVRDKFSVEGLMDRLTTPLLVVHGEKDFQVPLEHAKRMVHEAVNSPKAELFVAGDDEGGAQHCNLDNPEFAIDKIADWFAAFFNTRAGN